MTYNPNVPNGYDRGQIPYSVMSRYFEEVLLSSPLQSFMGSGPDSLINVVHTGKGHGTTVTYSFGREIDYKNPIYGYDQIEGAAQNVKFYVDVVTMEKQALTDGLQGIQITEMTTPIPVFDSLKPRLMTAHNRNLNYSIVAAATTNRYPDLDVGLPSPSRGQFAGLAAYPANINAGVAAMNTGIAYNQNGISVAKIRAMRNIAATGSTLLPVTAFETEKRINPYLLQKRKGWPEPVYVYFMDTMTYESLMGDPVWSAYLTRGVIESEDQPTGLRNAFYKGRIGDTLIYEVPELAERRITSGGFTASWNLFCGANAIGLCWNRQPWFYQKEMNMGTEIQLALHEMRGQKALSYPSFANEQVSVENAIIHSFVRIV
jgi:hypothetical protein